VYEWMLQWSTNEPHTAVTIFTLLLMMQTAAVYAFFPYRYLRKGAMVLIAGTLCLSLWVWSIDAGALRGSYVRMLYPFWAGVGAGTGIGFDLLRRQERLSWEYRDLWEDILGDDDDEDEEE